MAKLPKFDDYLAPWEVGSDGKAVAEDEQKLEPAKLKKYLHGLLSDKERLQTTVTEVTGKRDELQGKVDEITRKDETETERLKRENEELRAATAKGSGESAELRALRLEVALDKGLTAVQAKRLVGTTREEFEADADDLVESWGGAGTEGEEEGQPPSRQPKKLRSGGGDVEDDGDIDVTKALDSIPRI